MPISDIFVQNTGTALEDGGTTDLTTIPDLSVQFVNFGKQPTGGSAYGETINVSADVVAGLTVSDYDRFRIVFRDASTEAELFKSAPLDVSTLEVSDITYAAPAQQETDVVIPAGPTGGANYLIKITNVESGAQPFEPRSYEVEVDDGESATDIVSKFITAINDREDSINDYQGSTVTASEPTAGTLRLTADNVGDIFKVGYQNFEPVSETTNTYPTLGQGTYEQVKTYEEQSKSSTGQYVVSTNLLGSLPEPPVYASTGGNYDLISISCENDYDKGMNKSIGRLLYMVALESAVVGNASDGDTSGTVDFAEWLAPKVIASDR